MANYFLTNDFFKSPQKKASDEASLLGIEPTVTAKDFLSPEEIRKPENKFLWVLDQLAKTERLSANVAMWMMGQENFAPLEVLSGRRRTNFQDVSETLGFDGAFGKAMGFGMGVIADPLTWMSFGTLSGAKKAAQLATARGITKVADVPKLGRLLRNKLTRAQKSGVDVLSLGANRAEKEARGQWTAITFMGKDVTPGFISRPAAKFFDKGSDMWQGSGPGKFVRKVFTTNTLFPKADALRRVSIDRGRSRALSALERVTPLRALIKRIPAKDLEEIAFSMQRNPTKVASILGKAGLSAKESKEFLSLSTGTFEKLLKVQQAKGIDIHSLKDQGQWDLEYLPFKFTQKFADFLNKTSPAGLKFPKNVRKYSDKHVSMLKRNFENLDSFQVNRRGRAGQLTIDGVTIPAIDFDVLSNDIPSLVSVAMLRAARAITSVEYMDEMSKGFGVPLLQKVVRDANGIEKVVKEAPRGHVIPRNSYWPKDKALPEELASTIDETFDKLVNSDELNGAIGMINDFTNVFKASTLALIPSFHLRNGLTNAWVYAVSGAWKNPEAFAKGVALSVSKKHYGKFSDDLWDTARMGPLGKNVSITDPVTKRVISGDELWKEIKDHNIGGGFGVSENSAQFKRALSGYKENLAKKLWRGTPLSVHFKPYAWGFDVGNKLVEDPFRIGMYLDGRMRGLSPDLAAIEVKKWLFDYSELSKFEREWLKPVFPFYSWMRKNIPRQIELALEKPGQLGFISKAKQAIERDQIKNNPDWLPEWIKAGSPIQMRNNTETGETEYMLLKAFIPAADLAELVDFRKMLGGALTPLLKSPMEGMANRNFFFEQKIKNFPGEYSEYLGVPMDKNLSGVLRQIRLLNVANDVFFKNQDKPLVKRLGGFINPVGQFPVNIEREKKTKFFAKVKELGDIKREMRKSMFLYQRGRNRPTRLKNLQQLSNLRSEIENELQALKQ